MKRKFQKLGFSLIEVMIAIAALSVAVLGVMGSLTFGVVAGNSASNFSQATHLAREIAENIRVDRFIADPFNPPPGLVDVDPNVRTILKAPPFDQEGSSLASFRDVDASIFRRNIQIIDVDPGRLVNIRVKVFWTQQSKERFVEVTAVARSGS